MQSVQGDNVEGDTSGSGIYETVRTEVRRAIAEIQHDLEIVSYYWLEYVSIIS